MSTKKYVSLEKLGLYDEKIKGVISAGDTAAETAAKAYADGLAVNYDAAGAAATAESNAKSYTDTEVAKASAAAATAQAAAEAAAAAAATADGKAVAAQGEVDALEAYVGTIPEGATATDVVGYVIEKTSGIATEGAMTELGNRVGVVEGDVATIKGDYLKGADKTELEGKITNVQTAVDTEKGRAEGEETKLAGRIKAIEDDYLKAADKTELQGNINTLTGVVETLRDGVDAEKVDGVKDLIDYVEEHGTEVTGMKEDISENATAIAGVAGRMDTAEGKITAVEGAVATKVEQSVYDAKVAELAGADSALSGRIATLEGKFTGEGSVEDLIADAKAEAISAAASDAASKDEALETKITTAYKKYADDEDAKIESRVDALEADTHTHSNKTLLDTYTQTEANLADAVAKKHEHANAAVINAITSDNVTTWNTVTSKAAQSDLEAAVARIAANEAGIAAFVEVSEQEILDLFA